MASFIVTDHGTGKRFQIEAPSMSAAQDAFKLYHEKFAPPASDQPQDPTQGLPIPGKWNGVGYLDGKDAQGNPDPGSRTFGTSSSDTLNPIPAISAGADAAVGALPIAGKTLQGLRDQANANINGGTPADARAAIEKDKAANPGAVAVGEIAGRSAPYVAAAMNPVTAGAFGLEGTLGMRLLMGGLSSETLNVGDRVSKGEDPVSATVHGTQDTAAGLPFFMLGSEGPKPLASAAAPTVEALRSQADPLYKAAENSGVLFSQGSVKDFANQVTSDALKRGLDMTLTPKSVAVIKDINGLASSNMTMADAMTLRKKLGLAVERSMNSSDGDASMSMMILRKFDDFLENSTKAGPGGANPAVLSGDAAAANQNLRDANKLWSQAANGQLLDQAIALAESKSATNDMPIDKALRTEFGRIDQQIIKGDLPGFSKDQIQTIRDVAYGRGSQRLAQVISKIKGGPLLGSGSGTAGGMMGYALGGGDPAAVGTGAVLGAGASMGANALGSIGRRSVSRQAMQNAHYASAVARNPSLGPSSLGDIMPPVGITTLPATLARSGTVLTLRDWANQYQPSALQ